MVKIGTIIGLILSILLVAKFVVFGQSPTTKPSPSPTVTVPGGAPSTGMAAN